MTQYSQNERATRMLAHIAQIHRLTIVEHSPVKALNHVLQALLDLTDSEYGFVGEVLQDGEGKPFLRSYAVTNIGWNEDIRALYEKYITVGLDFRNLDTLFGEVIKTGQTIITNDAPQHPAARGVPPGHPPLRSFAGVAVHSGDQMVGMYGLANRQGGYTDELIEEMRPLAAATVAMINGLRLSREVDAVRGEASRQADLRRAMVRASGECVLVVDPQGRIREFNPAASQLFGWAESEVIGVSATALLVPAGQRAKYEQLLRDSASGEGTLELPVLTRDGRQLMIEATVARITAGDDGAIAVFIRDVSQQHRAAQELQRARELNEQTTKGKLSFIAVVSHEIRTPLATIASALDLLGDCKLDDEARAYLNAAQTASNSLLDLVANVLDFSRLEAGEARAAEGRFQPRALLQSLHEQFTPAAQARGLQLQLQTPAVLPAELRGDEVRIRQILANLLSNAIKFTTDGHVSLSASAVPIGTGWLRVTFDVRDTGTGMPEEFRHRVFGHFAQADSSLSRSRSGTGLGLAISRRLASLMGGTLELVDTSAQGTHFQLRLDLQQPQGPVADAAAAPGAARAAAAPAKAVEPRHRGKSTVLAVDDNILNQTLLRKQLQRGGYEVSVASSGGEALGLMLARRFDVVLMDLEMPGMDGIETVRRYRAEEAARGLPFVPIIALTGHAPVDYRLRAIEAGMNGFLTKPYRIQELLETLESSLPPAGSPTDGN
ncbi:MAG: hypothetical protein RL026_1905 [Pseudomonadota bacterium]